MLQTSETLFFIIKIAGALYLFYLAVQLWRAPCAPAETSTTTQQPLWSLLKQEFLVAAGNPKAILIFTAFLPQFVDAGEAAAPKLAVLGALFVVLEWLAIAAYAYVSSHLSRWFASAKRRQTFNRICGSLLGVAGLGLLAARRSSNSV